MAKAANWERAAHTVSVGKEAYVKQMAAQAANASITPEQFVFLWNAQEKRYATAMNIIGNMSSSGYHYEIRSR